MGNLGKFMMGAAALAALAGATALLPAPGYAQDRGEFLRSISDQVGIYYVFRANCEYSQAEGPVIADFSKRTGITVHAISLDGSRSLIFANSMPDNGRLEAMGFTSTETPGFLLYQRPTAQGSGLRACNNPKGCLSFIGSGTMSEAELAEHIFTLLAAGAAAGS